ncbi:hypothetical protein BDQ17DRAFT_1418133 [Cyathus striatus]|nr:hypothetical protein BDQ17DRAFT_1418133 [Cyathus striatus]
MNSLTRTARLVYSANLRSRVFVQNSPHRLLSFTTSTIRQSSCRPFLWISALTFTTIFAFTPHVYLDSGVAQDTSSYKFDEDAEVVTDPATSLEFPKTIRAPAKINAAPLTVVGVDPKALSPEEKVEYIVRNTTCIIRIVPTRSTNYNHLRDAFMRALQSRLATGIRDGTISEKTAAETGPPLRKLKSIFPNSPLAKRTPLDVLLAPPLPGHPRVLIFRDLGAIECDWVATEFVLNYFDRDAPSPPLKKQF